MIVGIVAINRFPMWQKTVAELGKLCDRIYFRWDGINGDPEITKGLEALLGDKFGGCMIMKTGWDISGKRPQWREDCLRMLDRVGMKPGDVVLCPDEDEVFGEGIAEELKMFAVSDKKGMMFSYDPLATKDNRIVNAGVPYPPDPHMKAFKWEPNLSYYPYHGDAKIAKYCNKDQWWIATTKIKHYCCWTKEMELAKAFRSNTPKRKADKAVTIIGFGPSSKQKMETLGEVWSLNNCYDALCQEAMQLCTRIFEMHKLEKRRDEVGKDGAPHLWHLDRCGKEGRRIILQQPDAQITNSEAYPLQEVIAKTGMRWFAGSPCYMLALAICEGYTDIWIYGLDQMDWEHTLQRECFAGWCMFAIGAGIRLHGCITWMKPYTKLYGYDYGPEFDAYQEELMWRGHPLQIHYKIPSRVVDGKLFDGKR